FAECCGHGSFSYLCPLYQANAANATVETIESLPEVAGAGGYRVPGLGADRSGTARSPGRPLKSPPGCCSVLSLKPRRRPMTDTPRTSNPFYAARQLPWVPSRRATRYAKLPMAPVN